MAHPAAPPLHLLFDALGDRTRFGIVEKLLTQGAQPVAALRDGVDMSAPAFSRHLKVLVERGVLDRRVAAQQRIYSVKPVAIEAIGSWVMSHHDFWPASLDRLAAALAEEPAPT